MISIVTTNTKIMIEMLLQLIAVAVEKYIQSSIIYDQIRWVLIPRR
jgi:hypothetical protein